MSDVFISYSRRDSDFVRRLDEALVEREYEVWVDYEDIPPTAQWRDEIGNAISAADVVVFVLTPASLASRECAVELEAAFAQNKRVISLMRAEPAGEPVPERIAEINWIRATPDQELGAVVDTLVGAMRTDLAWVRQHTRLLLRAREWDGNARDRAYLLSGRDLRDAEAALSQAGAREPAPTDLQREYVAAGRAAADRRQRIVLAGVSVALLVAVGLAVVALIQRSVAISERQQAQSRQLAADAALNEQTDPELSVLLAAAAARVSPTAEAASSLREALVRSALRATLGETLDGESASLSRDGRYALTYGRRLKLWDVNARRAVLTFPAVPGSIREPAQFTADGSRLVVGDPDGSLGLWDVRQGRRLALSGRDRAAGAPLAIAVSADGLLAAAGGTRGAFVERLSSGELVPLFLPAATQIRSVAFAPDGKTVAGASPAGVEIWRVADGHLMVHLPLALEDAAPTVKFVDGGRDVVVTDTTLLWDWDLRAHRRIEQWNGSGDVSPDGTQAALVSGDDQHIVLLDLRSGHTLTIADGGQPLTVRFSDDGALLASADSDLAFRVYNTSDGSLAMTLAGPVTGGPSDVAFSSDSTRLITANAFGTVRVWQLSTPGQVIARGAFGARLAAAGSVLMVQTPQGIRVRRDGRGILLSGSRAVSPGTAQIDAAGHVVVGMLGTPGAVTLWHVGSGGAVPLVPASQAVAAVALSSDGRMIATVTTRGAVVLWDSRTARLLRRLGSAGSGAVSVSFAREDNVLVTGGGGAAVRVWPLAGASRPVTLPHGWPAVSPDGERVLVVSDPTSRVFPASGGRPIAKLSTPLGGTGAFSPDGRLLAVAGADGFARVWTSDGSPIAQLQHHDVVVEAAFSPNSEYLLTTSNDGYARVWESVTGQLLMIVPISFYQASATFTPGSRTFLVDGRAGVTQYDCEVCQPLPALLRLAAARVTRALTRAERDRYLGTLPTP